MSKFLNRDHHEPQDVVTEERGLAVAKPEKFPVEAIALRRGMLPEMVQPLPLYTGAPPAPPRVNPEYWRFAAARALSGWVIGAEVTEADFDKAVAAATDNNKSR